MRRIVSPPSLRSHFGFNLVACGDPRHDMWSPVVLSRSWTLGWQLVESSRQAAAELRIKLDRIELSILSTSPTADRVTGTITFFGSACAELAELQAELRRRGQIPGFMTSLAISQ
jgi:hypothetical protein